MVLYSIFSLTYLTFFVTSIETPAQVHEREEKERTLAQVYQKEKNSPLACGKRKKRKSRRLKW
jgi:hypothetical protein